MYIYICMYIHDNKNTINSLKTLVQKKISSIKLMSKEIFLVRQALLKNLKRTLFGAEFNVILKQRISFKTVILQSFRKWR